MRSVRRERVRFAFDSRMKRERVSCSPDAGARRIHPLSDIAGPSRRVLVTGILIASPRQSRAKNLT